MSGNSTAEPINLDSTPVGRITNPAPPIETSQTQLTRQGRRETSSKWLEWMDKALVRQVLATDPINCGRGSTAVKWGVVSAILQDLEPQPITKSPESCRQRVKKLVEIYKVSST